MTWKCYERLDRTKSSVTSHLSECFSFDFFLTNFFQIFEELVLSVQYSRKYFYASSLRPRTIYRLPHFYLAAVRHVISKICKWWQHVALKVAYLWTHLHVADPRKVSIVQHLEEWMNRAGALPLCLSLCQYGFYNEQASIMIAVATFPKFSLCTIRWSCASHSMEFPAPGELSMNSRLPARELLPISSAHFPIAEILKASRYAMLCCNLSFYLDSLICQFQFYSDGRKKSNLTSFGRARASRVSRIGMESCPRPDTAIRCDAEEIEQQYLSQDIRTSIL